MVFMLIKAKKNRNGESVELDRAQYKEFNSDEELHAYAEKHNVTHYGIERGKPRHGKNLQSASRR